MSDDQVPQDKTPQPPPVAPPPAAPPPVAPPVQPPYFPPPDTAGYAAPPAPGGGMGAWINAGWSIATGNLGMSILLMLIAMVPAVVVGIISNVAMQGSMRAMIMSGGAAPGPEMIRALWGKSMGANLVLSLPANVINSLLWVGIVACFWEGVRTGRITFDNIGLGFQIPGPAVVLGLIMFGVNLVITVTAMVCIGVLLAFPAVSFIWLAQYDLAVRRGSGATAASTAWTLVSANFMELAIMGLVSCAILMLGGLACGIGVFVAGPVVLCAYGVCYRDLAARAGIVTSV